MSYTQPQPPHDDMRPTTATEQIETSPDVVNDSSSTSVHVSSSSSSTDVVDSNDVIERAERLADDPNAGEQIAREKMAEDSNDLTDVNVLGDQDAVNLAGPHYPSGAELPTAQNVRRYPELFEQEVIDSFQVDDDSDAAVGVVVDDVSKTGDVVDDETLIDDLNAGSDDDADDDDDDPADFGGTTVTSQGF